MGRSLPFVDNNSAIKVFRQGLSLDEVCEVGHILWSRFHAVAYTLDSTATSSAQTCITMGFLIKQ